MKTLLAILFLLIASSAAAAPVAALPTKSITVCTGLCKQDWAPIINVGAGLPALSVRFDGRLGFGNAVAPLEVGLNFFQYVYTPTEINNAAGKHNFSFGRVALGLTVTKDPSSSDIAFGGYLVPFGIQVDSFAFGIGLGYTAIGNVTNNNMNWSIILPFSYNISVGG